MGTDNTTTDFADFTDLFPKILGRKRPIITDGLSPVGIRNNWALVPSKFLVGHPFNPFNP